MPYKIPDKKELIQKATDVIDVEIEALKALKNDLDDSFVELIKKCMATLDNGGKLVLCGVGKSGHISKKIAATLSSTGSQAVFMHPVEAMHGDLGVLSHKDLLLAVSYSGETDELLVVLPAVHRLGVEIVAITGKADSRLGQISELVVPMPVPREACPFNLAPTATTTALAALGDAIAMTLLFCHNFKINDYAMFHPAGAIGRSITLKVKDFMRTGEHLASVQPGTSVRDALLAMTKARNGAVAITDSEGKLLGIFTDGDFRRRITENPDVLTEKIENVMTPDPISINQDKLAVEIMKILEKRKIDDIPAVDDEGRLAGLVDIQDLPKFKVM